MTRTSELSKDKVAAALGVLKQLNLALKCLQLYSPGHGAVDQAVTKLLVVLRSYSKRFRVLAFEVTRTALLIDGQPVGKNVAALRTLALRLYRLRIQRLVFNTDTDVKQMLNFLSVICMDPAEVRGLGGVKELLWQMKVTAVAVTEAQIKLPYEEAADAAYAERRGAVEQVKRLLSTDHLSADGRRQILACLRDDPEGVAHFLGSLSGANGDADAGAQAIAASLPKIGEVIGLEMLDEQAFLLRTLTEAVLALDSPLKEHLIPKLLLLAEREPFVVRNLMEQLTNEELVQLIAVSLRARTLTWRQLCELLKKDPVRRTRLPQLASLLIYEGPPKTYEKQIQALAKAALQAPPMPAPLERVPESEILDFARRLNERGLEKLQHELAATTAGAIRRATVRRLTDGLMFDHELPKYRQLLKPVKQLLADALTTGDYDIAGTVVAALQTELKGKANSAEHARLLAEAIGDVGSRKNVEKLVAALEVLPDADSQHPIVKYLGSLGKAAFIHLFDMLAAEPTRTRRMLICRALVDLGRHNLGALGSKIGDHRWYVVRNVVMVLGQMGDERVLPYLDRATTHDEPRVRLETTRALASLGSQTTGRLLGLVNDRDLSVGLGAVEALGTLKDKAVAKPLIEILERQDPTYRKTPLDCAIIRLLASLRARNAMPALRALTQRRSLFFWSQSRSIRQAAETALRELAVEAADG